ncbi:MAG: hypothetical protein WAT61_02845 [Flavobacteriales bacterium]
MRNTAYATSTWATEATSNSKVNGALKSRKHFTAACGRIAE